MKQVNIILLTLSAFMATLLAKLTLDLGLISLAAVSLASCAGFIALERLLQKEALRTFNTTALSLVFGALFASSVIYVLDLFLTLTEVTIDSKLILFINSLIALTSIFASYILTKRAENSLYLSIPFIRFTPKSTKKKDFILTPSSLSDPRIIDLGASGLIDHALILPRFLLRYFQAQQNANPNSQQFKRPLETIEKLKNIEDLALRISEVDPAHLENIEAKLAYLAEVLDANLITAEASALNLPGPFKRINLHKLASAFKPLMEGGENMSIKIQRTGKEPGQGVGYLEDGTMVVVNGGGDFLGEIIDVHVLSTKHTSSGRMIFCNAQEDDDWD